MQNLSNSPVKKRENQRTLLHLPEPNHSLEDCKVNNHAFTARKFEITTEVYVPKGFLLMKKMKPWLCLLTLMYQLKQNVPF